MLPRNRGDTTRAERPAGTRPAVHSVLAVFSSKEPRPDRSAGDGVSTYLALIFGTLLSSQGTDTSFVLTRETLSGFPPGASLRTCASDSIRLFRVRFPVGGICLLALKFPSWRFSSRPFDIHYVSRFPRQLIIESLGSE